MRRRRLPRPQLQREGDELLLRAVVQVDSMRRRVSSAVATMRAREAAMARAGCPVRGTETATPSPATVSRVPMKAGTTEPHQQPSTVAVPSVSYRSTIAMSAPDSCASSPAAPEEIFAAVAALATSVATRRSAACSPASRSVSSRTARSSRTAASGAGR